ncbi:MAG: histidine kinase dimerization/phospho-acceptor domain-containing protein, partial [Frankiaceae bacterium]
MHGWLPLLLLLVTAGCDFVEVRLRHGDETEALALFEAGVVADALLLAPGSAVLVAPLALAIASLIARRPAAKTIFNLGSHAMGSAALVGLVALFSTPGGGVTWQVVIGLVLGTVAFALINAVCLALVLAVKVGVPVRESLLDSWQLSAIMAVGSIGLGAVAVVVLMNAPALAPFTLLPAVAMMMAFRAKVQEAEERERSGKLLELSQVLAGRRVSDDLLSSFLNLLRETFGAGTAVIVLEGDEENPGVVVEAGEAGVRRRQLTALDAALLARIGAGGELVRSGLPEGWGRMLLAPLDAEGIRLGVLALVEPYSRRPRLKERDLAVLTPLVSALGAALRAADHLERLVAETSKLKAVVDFSSDGIYVLDPEGRVVVWNPAIAQVTGVEADAAVGRPLTTVMSALGAEGGPVDPLREAFDELTPAEPRATVEMGVQRPDGEQRWLRAAHAAVFDGNDLVRDVVIAHDITRERQVERMKADFIATVSHELRTPVTPIKGYVDLLRRKGDSFTPDKRRECLDIVADRVAHLGRLVEDLLLASRVSSPASAVRMSSGDLVHLTAKAVGD